MSASSTPAIGPNALGRIYIPDDRDDEYPMREGIRRVGDEVDAAVDRGWRYWWADGWWGDQWYTPQCVAYAWTHWVEDGPVTHAAKAANRSAVHGQGMAIVRPKTFYDQCQQLDYWEGTDYDGTSVRAGAKALKIRGLVSAYRWAFEIEDVVDALLLTGPVMFGTNWYSGMSEPDDDGVVQVSGDVVGGHAYLLNGVNLNQGVIRFKNSWGRGWGKTGHGYLTIEDAERLLHEYGEACLADEIATDQ